MTAKAATPAQAGPAQASPAPASPAPASPAPASPAMAQWFATKQAHPDALLFFRMGDFYELFFEDAEAAAVALDIALTARGEHANKPIPMCGVPFRAADAYLSRLIRRGFRVAVCEQMEPASARQGKAPIRREVVRLVTPGTLTEDTLLEAGRPNLLLAVVRAGRELGAAWLDVSTGLFETAAPAPGALPALLGRLDPAEILAPADLPLADWEARRGPVPTPPAAPVAARLVAERLGVASLDAFGAFTDGEAMAMAAALDYVRTAGAGQMPRLSPPVPASDSGHMLMDAATRASLEITRARDGGTEHTLLGAVQRTITAPGARLLGAWLGAPLLDTNAVRARQDGWGWLLTEPERLLALRTALRGAPDIARALGRLSLDRGTPRDLGAVAAGLSAARDAAEALAGGPLSADALRVDPALADLLRRALADPLPARLEEGGTIAPGFDGELDAERGLRDDSRRVVAQLTLGYAQRFGVASLKIRHHAQLGYVMEAPAAAVDRLKANPELTLRQSMANGGRFTTPELSDLDRRISEAADRAAARERTVWAELVRFTLRHGDALAACAARLAELDVLQGAARLAEGGDWCRPLVTDDARFRLLASRHPVVEAALKGQARFVPNDADLSAHRRVLLLTGPNMAGKSTFLRQVALAAVLAQAGLPVPAASAEIGAVDRLFSRVGAADDLARGRSTFMVEMTETAAILHQAGPRSLVVVDEIGRGTGTMDGLAIAWAVLEALHAAGARTVFATHFHELAQLPGRLPRVCSHTMRVKEWGNDVVFLHEVAEGAAGRSWGVHVARLAGVPAPVVRRAAALLTGLEGAGPSDLPLFAGTAPPQPLPVHGPDPVAGAVLDALEAIDPDKLAPRDALAELYRLKALLPPAAVEGSRGAGSRGAGSRGEGPTAPNPAALHLTA